MFGETLPTTGQEWKTLLASGEESVIKSHDEWTALLRGRLHPLLPGCDEAIVERFTEGLLFRNGGLAHADYGVVADKLTFNQFAALWAHFGLSMKLFLDYQDYYCAGAGTCSPQNFKICTDAC